MHLLDVAWLVIPAYGSEPGLMDLGALVSVCGITVAVALLIAGGAEPASDEAKVARALEYESP
jgi:hypothetical protein